MNAVGDHEFKGKARDYLAALGTRGRPATLRDDGLSAPGDGRQRSPAGRRIRAAALGRGVRLEGVCDRVVALASDRRPQSDQDFFFQAEDGIRDLTVTGVQTCALPI